MLLAVLLFAVMILFYMLSKSSITRAIDKNYSLMLSQITTIMDAHLNNGKTIASGFFNDRNIKDIATNGKDRFSLRSVDSAIHIKNELERYTLLFRDANSAFIFFPEAELLISADGIRRLDLFSLTENTYDFESGLMESITAGKELEECMVGGNYITLTIPVSIGKKPVCEAQVRILLPVDLVDVLPGSGSKLRCDLVAGIGSFQSRCFCAYRHQPQ